MMYVCIMCVHNMCLIISSPVPATTTTSGSRRPLKKKATRGGLGDNDPEPEKEVSEEKDGNIKIF